MKKCRSERHNVFTEEIIKITLVQMMIKNASIDESIDLTNKNIKELNPIWPQIPDQLQRTLITRGSGSGEMNSLFNLTSQQQDIEKIY